MADQDAGKNSIQLKFPSEMLPLYFSVLEKTKGVRQMEIHHPEGDVFNHSLQVLKWAFRESINTDLILAAMLHDVGKIINSKGHDKIGAEMLKYFVSAKTHWLIEQHMRVWYLILGEMKKLSKVKELAGHPWLPDLILLARWDKLGRKPNTKIQYDKNAIIRKLDNCVNLHFNKLPY